MTDFKGPVNKSPVNVYIHVLDIMHVCINTRIHTHILRMYKEKNMMQNIQSKRVLNICGSIHVYIDMTVMYTFSLLF